MSDPMQHEPQGAPPSGVPAPHLPTSSGLTGRSLSENLDLLKSLFLGTVATAIFYEVFPIPFMEQGRLLSVFGNGDWVSPTIMGMTFSSLFLIGFKALRHRAERRAWQAFRHPTVAAVLSGRIYARDVERVVQSLDEALRALKLKRYADSIAYRRVLRVLTFMRSAPKKEGLDTLLDYQSGIEVKKLESSYTVLQVFIWAIPILGFIGTVMGIGSSVNEFSQFIQTADSGGEFTGQMRAALGGVTSGLAVAFNTTFLALVLVMPVMLLTSMLHKGEEELLLEIEEYCLEELLPLLHVKPGEEVLAEGYEDHLHRIMRLSETWLGQFEPLVTRLSRQAEMMGHQLAGIQPLIKDFTDRLLLRGRGAVGEPMAPPASPPGQSVAAERPEHEEDQARTT